MSAKPQEQAQPEPQAQTWQEARRWIREKYRGVRARNLLAVLDGLVELAGEAGSTQGSWSSLDIQRVACVDKSALPGCMLILGQAGLVARQEVRSKGHRGDSRVTLMLHMELEPNSGNRSKAQTYLLLTSPQKPNSGNRSKAPSSGIQNKAPLTPETGVRTASGSAPGSAAHSQNPDLGVRPPLSPPPHPLLSPEKLLGGVKGKDQAIQIVTDKAQSNSDSTKSESPPPPQLASPQDAMDELDPIWLKKHGRKLFRTPENLIWASVAKERYRDCIQPSFQAYLDDPGKGDYLEKAKHPLKIFAEQPDTYFRQPAPKRTTPHQDAPAAALIDQAALNEAKEFQLAWAQLTEDQRRQLTARAVEHNSFLGHWLKSKGRDTLGLAEMWQTELKAAWPEYPAKPEAS